MPTAAEHPSTAEHPALPPAPSQARKRRIELNRRRDTYLRRLLGVADLVSFTAALSLSLAVFGEDDANLVIIGAPFAVILLAKLLGLYDRDAHLVHKTTLEEVPALFSISAFTVLLLFLSGDFFVDGNFEGRQGIGTLLVMFGLMVVLRSGARRLWRARTPSERCLLVGDTTRAEALSHAIELSDAAHVELVGVGPTDEETGEPGKIVADDALLDELEIDRVIIAPGRTPRGSEEAMFAIRELRDAGVKVSLIPDASRLVGTATTVDPLGGLTLLGMRRFSITRSSRWIKRSFDFTASATLLALLSPLLGVIAIAIRMDGTGGPILYRQRRIGRDGRPFEIIKFRTMRPGAHDERQALSELDEGADGLFKIPDDPRATPIGQRLRRRNLDELPQLLNVFRGEMSLVGPRPLIPEEDVNVPALYRRRLDVRPGITGHWQVLGSARVPLEEMVKLDYLYVANWSLWGDVLLIVRTIPLMTRRRGL